MVDLAEAEEFEEVASVPLPSLPYSVSKHTFVALSRPENAVTLGKFTNIMKFRVREVSHSFFCSHGGGCETSLSLELCSSAAGYFGAGQGVISSRCPLSL